MRSTPPILVITGASGRLGRAVMPHLEEAGIECRIAGRDAHALAARFPGRMTADYDGLPDLLAGAHAVLHLAVLNNDKPGDAAAFRAANVDLALDVARKAARAGVPHFIDIGSLHADRQRATPYAVTKREAAKALDAYGRESGLTVTRLILPAVRGVGGGKLARLEALPGRLGAFAVNAAGLLKPTVRASTVARAIVEAVHAPSAGSSARIVSDRQTHNSVYLAVKRVVDIAAGTALLGPFLPLSLGVWLWLRMSGETQPIFAQERVGRAGRSFTCYKFRTMRVGTANLATHEISAASVTPTGAVLRRLKLDELPQAWNVLKGEMSLVGPRPCLPVQRELIDARHALGVLDIAPGITGWSQVRNIDMSDPERLAAADAEYAARRTLALDLAIVVRTVTGHGQGDRTAAVPTDTGPAA